MCFAHSLEAAAPDWLCCFGPVVKQHIMEGVCDTTRLLASWPGSEQEEAEEETEAF